MPGTGDELNAAQLRALAAKCRRLSGNMSDQEATALLRRMAVEYESLADRKDQAARPEPPHHVIL
jgi:hypothetical protein